MPRPGMESIDMLPPDASITRFTIDRPRPLPELDCASLPLKKGSQAWLISNDDIPFPLSDMVNSYAFGMMRPWISTRQPYCGPLILHGVFAEIP